MRNASPLLATLLLVTSTVCVPADCWAAEAIRAVRPMPFGRAFHGACVLGDHLFVLGGASYTGQSFGQFVSENELAVYHAPILADGELGEWKTTTPLPAPRHYLANSTVVLNDVVYIVGGTDEIQDGKRHTTILMNRAQADGGLGQWEETAKFPDTGLSFTTAFSTPGWLHMVAGVTSDRKLSPKTWSVEVKPDGHLGEWREGPSLPASLWYHQSGVSGGRVYVFGGLETYPDADKINGAVFAAPLLGDGRIGDWTTSSPLPQAFYGGASSSIGPYIMSFMGRYAPGSRGENGDVWWAVTGPDGLSSWTRMPSKVATRRYHALASDYRRSSFYLVGGKVNIDSGGYPNVYLFSLTPEARAFAERGWNAGDTAGGDSSENTASLSASTPISAGGPSITGLPEFFLPYQLASQYDDRGNTRPMVMYFMAPDSKPTIEQNAQLNDPVARDAAGRAVFAAVNVVANPQIAQQRGVFRVPTWLFFDSKGVLIDRHTGSMSAQELADKVATLR